MWAVIAILQIVFNFLFIYLYLLKIVKHPFCVVPIVRYIIQNASYCYEFNETIYEKCAIYF